MEDEKIVGYVTAFLKKKGFTQTEKIFQEEFQHNKSNTSNSVLEPDIANHLLAFSQYFSTSADVSFLHHHSHKPYYVAFADWRLVLLGSTTATAD